MSSVEVIREIDPAARVSPEAKIGPFCVVGPNVTIGPQTVLSSRVSVTANTAIGSGNRNAPAGRARRRRATRSVDTPSAGRAARSASGGQRLVRPHPPGAVAKYRRDAVEAG